MFPYIAVTNRLFNRLEATSFAVMFESASVLFPSRIETPNDQDSQARIMDNNSKSLHMIAATLQLKKEMHNLEII